MGKTEGGVSQPTRAADQSRVRRLHGQASFPSAAFRGGGQGEPGRPPRAQGAPVQRKARENRGAKACARGAQALLQKGRRQPHIQVQGPCPRVHQTDEGEQGRDQLELGAEIDMLSFRASSTTKKFIYY